MAKVRLEHYNNRRKAKLLLLNNTIHKIERSLSKTSPELKSIDASPIKRFKPSIGERVDRASLIMNSGDTAQLLKSNTLMAMNNTATANSPSKKGSLLFLTEMPTGQGLTRSNQSQLQQHRREKSMQVPNQAH